VTRDDSNLIKSGLVQLIVAVVGGLVVWYAIVEVKIAKAESAVVENKQGITQNKTDIKELEIGQKARERAVSEFYRDHWPRVGANTKAIENLGEAVAEMKKINEENRKLLLKILQRVR
jgi:hypothetical protein